MNDLNKETKRRVLLNNSFGCSLTPEERLLKAIFGNENKNTPKADSDKTKTNKKNNGKFVSSKKSVSVLIEKDKKLLVAFIGDNKYVIRCHEEDRYDWKVGLGVAISNHIYKQNEKEMFFLRKRLRERHYYLYCYNKFFDFDTTAIEKIVEDYEKEYQELLIKEQVRKAECEIRKQKYEPRTIERKFIKLA